MPSSSREKSPRVSKVFAKISSDSKLQRNPEEEQKDESKDGSSASSMKSPEGKDAAESVKPKKTKRSILPYFRSHKNGKKGEKEKEKLKKEKGGDKDSNGKDAPSSASPNKETDAQLPQVAEAPEAEAPELVTKDADVLSPKELAESECVSTSDVTEVTDCISQISTDFSERASEPFQGIPENEDLDFRPYSALHTSQTPIYETPIRMPQNYQKSFLHNRYGSNSSVETLPGRFDRIPSGSSSISSISSFSTLAALRSRTLEPVSRRTQDPLGSQMPITYTRCSTLDTVRARFQNNVTNLTYEGVDFSSGPQSLNTSNSTWSLGSKGFTSPFSKFSLNSSESSKASSKEKEKKSKGTAESKVTAKSGVKKILLNNRLKEETISETSPERKPLIAELPLESKLKVEPVKSNQDSITIISNKNVRAKLNITVVKTPELTRKNLGSFRFARTGIRSSVRSSQKKRKHTRSPPSSSPPPSLTPTSPTSVRLKPGLKTIDGKIIPEYAKVNKRKNSKPDIVDEDSGEKVLPLLTHTHESPAEKAPVVKKIEAAAHKGRKDLEPSVKVNPVKRAESFKGPSRVCRRSSFTYATRAKVFKEGLDPDSFVKSQAIKLRRKDSKNGRFDMKNARKAEYRLSVTIKPSTVATLTNKFNTMISQNQAGNPIGKAELPVGHVSLHETRVTRSPKPNVRFKNRTKMGRNYSGTKEKFKEGACLMDEKSIKEEKNREEKRGDLSVPGARKTNPRTSRSPSPKKTAGKSGTCLLEKLGDNKTDEEKVCEKIKTALSSAKFKGETDDSEDDVVDQEANGETKYKVRVPSSTSPVNSSDTGGDTSQSSSAVPAVPVAGVSSTPSKSPASESTIPKIMKSPGKPPSSNLRDILAKISERNVNHYTEIDEVYPLPERHAKSDSMDSGISTEGELLSGAGSISIGNTTLIISSVPSFPVCSQDHEDSSLDTVKSTETAKSEDSAVAFQDIVRSEDIMDQAEETILDSNMDEVSVVSSEEKGIIDVLETEGKGADGNTEGSESEEKALKDSSTVSQSEVPPGSKDTDEVSECASPKTVQENIVVEEDLEEKIIEPDTRSMTSSCMDDTHSEVSSVCSEAKSKKPAKGQESRIYSAVKAAVKNTVKKTKEKDAERKEEKDKEKRNRSPSADREKWYRRGRSKERRQDKKKEEKDQEGTEEQDKCEEDVSKGDEKAESPKKEAKEREGRTYERFTFKKLREKSQERRRFKEKTKEEEEKRREEEKKNADDTKKDTKSKKKEEKSKDDSTYGKFTIGSRSRSRDRKKIKEKLLDQLSIEPIDIKDSQEVSPSPKTADSLKQQESPTAAAAAASVKEKENSTGTLPFLNRNKNENLVFTFDTESIYDKPLTPKVNMKSKTLPPPPKTPIPSPPSSATPLPPPPNTPIPDPPIESEKDRDSLEASLLSKDSDDHCNGDSDSSNETENIYENLYSPNMEKLHRNREKLEGRGIKPNNSFLWSDGVPPTPAITEPPKTEPISEESESERSPFTRLIGVKTYGKTNRYGKISPSSKSKDSGADGHNYAELQPTSEDTQTIAYDDIGAVSAVSYDDISAPSSCGYDDIGTSSSTGYDTIKPPSEGYDPVNPPRSDSSQYDDCDGGIVTAQLAVVREDQLDSISYMYDEISMYNASQNSHSYEPVYPPGVSPQGRPGVSSIEEVPETDSSTPAPTPTASTIPNTKEPKGDYNNESSDGSEDESEDGVHEVFSYKLTRIGGGLDAAPSTSIAPTTPTTPSTPGSTMHARIYGSAVPPPLSFCPGVGCEANLSGGGGGGGDPAPSPSLSPTEGKSETSDEWMDVSDTETDTSTGPPISIVTQIPLVRMRQRSKRYRHHRNWRRSWSQGVRDVAAHMQAHAHHHHHHHHHQSHAHTIGHHHEHHHHRYHHHHHHHHGSSSSSSSAARGESGRDYSWRDVYVTSSSTIVLGQSEPNTYDTAYSPGYYNASLLSGASTNSSLYYESAKIRSIFYEGDDNEAQEISLYVEGGDSDDEDNATGHYEAIYEVISPAEDGHQCDEQDSDDSFESDDSNDAYTRLRPQFHDDGSQTSRDQAESLSSEVSTSEKLQLKLQSPCSSSSRNSNSRISNNNNAALPNLPRLPTWA
ncbi:microtubule-associated protein futsch-like isoform X2 [Macrobrachium nipponense]